METRKPIRPAVLVLLVLLLAALGFGLGRVGRHYRSFRIVRIADVRLYSLASEGRGAALEAEAIYDLVAPACVGIRTELTSRNVFGQIISTPVTGSGFLLRSDGYLLTNYHVVEDALAHGAEVMVTCYDGSSYPARVLGGDPTQDVALLKIDGTELPFVELANFDGVEVGDRIYAIGNPLGELTWSMTAGRISALDREIAFGSGLKLRMFQLDAAINSGNSGGPVINDRGQVIGIASAKYRSQGVEGIAFGIPINAATAVVDSIR